MIYGCDLQSNGITDTDIESSMCPEESKALLIDLLKAMDRSYTLDQILHMIGLVCGISNGTGHNIWATKIEIAEFGDKITHLQ